MQQILNLVDGHWVPGDGGELEVSNPWLQAPQGTVSTVSAEMAQSVITKYAASAREIAKIPLWRRKEMLERVAVELEKRADAITDALVFEGGKTRSESAIEVRRAIEGFTLTAAALVSIEGKTVPMSVTPPGEGRLGIEYWVPAGMVIAIAPFNAPLNLVSSKVSAALAAGCQVLVKPPLEAPTPGNLVGEAVLAAGWPERSIAVLHGGVETGNAMVTAPEPRVVAFTGSSAAGKAISNAAGFKNLVLELGSIAPTILCNDANLDDAVKLLVRGAFGSSGQACISTQRLFVERSIVDDFTERFVAKTQSLVVGDPSDPATDLGPLITAQAHQRVLDTFADARDRGANMLTGGGSFKQCIEPTIFSEVDPNWPIARRELFGPGVVILPFDSDDEVVRVANDTEFGLQAGVFTNSLDRALRYVEELDFGSVQVNETSRVRLDLHAFGGVKDSGLGREGTHHMLRAMMERKFVGIRRA